MTSQPVTQKNNPVSGASYLLTGLKLIGKPGLRRFVVMPALINIILFAGVIWGGMSYLPEYVDKWLPDWLSWLHWLLWPLIALTLTLIAFIGVLLLANVIAAPFNAILAERVEASLLPAGHAVNGGIGQAVRDIPKLLASEMRKLLYFILRAIPLLILFLIPGINLIAPFTWIAFSAWFLAIEYADYPLGNHRIGFTGQRRILRSRRWLSLGFGGASLALTMVPGLNFIAIPASVAGVTAMAVREGLTQENA